MDDKVLIHHKMCLKINWGTTSFILNIFLCKHLEEDSSVRVSKAKTNMSFNITLWIFFKIELSHNNKTYTVTP